MEIPKFNPVVWFEIYVDDMERATKFYETVLHVVLTDLPDPTEENKLQMKAFPSADFSFGACGTLVKMEGMKAGGSNIIIYFGCEDCAVEESRVETAGGRICQSKMSIGEHGFCSIVSDTEGNTFGLHSMK